MNKKRIFKTNKESPENMRILDDLSAQELISEKALCNLRGGESATKKEEKYMEDYLIADDVP